MTIKEENSKRVRRLEEELSEENIAVLFNSDKGVARRIIVRRGPSRSSIARATFICFVLAVAVAALLQFYQFRLTYNSSMIDTIQPQDLLILSIDAYHYENVKFGDIIIHDSWIIDPEGDWYELCTRVIGIPGDLIEITGGNVYRNGERLDEPYIGGSRTAGEMALLVPDGNYFVLGDNRDNSIDSRDPRVGYIAQIMIKGKVTFRLLPASRFGRIN